ncbi:hypothetical protein [Fibrella forsythiae]|uniref:Uncharacterized protein n=1 Tax=Fibrella forsythiae TaxID=2817061 RepID=A0ABS3JBU7_9BACT|nr:hypothetical protein [Fibrella forsythiae]MBO0947471.1 hypothetical protein [Fibrella forsythiae]
MPFRTNTPEFIPDPETHENDLAERIEDTARQIVSRLDMAAYAADPAAAITTAYDEVALNADRFYAMILFDSSFRADIITKFSQVD